MKQFFARAHLRFEHVADRLGAAGLARQINALNLGECRRSHRADHLRHRIGDNLPVLGIDRNRDLIWYAGGLQYSGRQVRRVRDVGPDHVAPGRYRAKRSSQLNRGGRNRALTDTDRDGFAGKPLLLEVPDLPLFRWHDTADFLRKIDAGFLTEAQHGRVLRDAFNPQLLRQGVEEDVARLVDAFVDVHHAMHLMTRGDPALEVASVELGAAIADHVHVLRDAFLQACGRHDDLEG